MKLYKRSKDTLFLENKMNLHDCGIIIFNGPTRANLADIGGSSWSATLYSHWVPLCDAEHTSVSWLPKEEHHA